MYYFKTASSAAELNYFTQLYLSFIFESNRDAKFQIQ